MPHNFKLTLPPIKLSDLAGEVLNIDLAVDGRLDWDSVVSLIPANTFADATTTVVKKRFIADNTGATNVAATWTTFVGTLVAGDAVDIPKGTYRFDTAPTQINVPGVVVEGASASFESIDATTTYGITGSIFQCAAGIAGVLIGPLGLGCQVRNLYIRSLSSVLGTNDGITVKAPLCQFDNVIVDGFGRDGWSIDTSVSGNANSGSYKDCKSFHCKRDGMLIKGNNSNANRIEGFNAQRNAGWGIRSEANANIFIDPESDFNTLGAFILNSSSDVWLNAYTEAGATIDGLTVDVGCTYLTWIQGNFGKPTITNNNVQGANTILIGGAFHDALQMTGTGGTVFALRAGIYGSGILSLTIPSVADVILVDSAGVFYVITPARFSAGVRMAGLPTYADNAAAVAGGLVAGDIYKTATGEVRVRV